MQIALTVLVLLLHCWLLVLQGGLVLPVPLGLALEQLVDGLDRLAMLDG